MKVKVHREFIQTAEDALVEINDRIADAVAQRARNRAPVDTGALAASIHRVKLPDGSFLVGSSVPYASDVEFGTSRNKGPQPYMRPASDSVKVDPPDLRIL